MFQRKTKVFLSSMVVLTIFLAALVGCLLGTGPARAESAFIDVRISPDGAKLSVGQTQLFVADIRNGSAPFRVLWFANGSYVGSGPSISYSFKAPCNYMTLKVEVTDSLGNVGANIAVVYDPSGPSFSSVIQAGSMVSTASRIVFYDSGIYYARNGLSGAIDYSGTVASVVEQSAINAMNPGESIYFKTAIYEQTAQVTFSKDATIICEGGVIFKWTGTEPATNLAMFTNSADGTNIRWRGGVIDQNFVALIYGIGFGTDIETNPNKYVSSLIVEDLRITNVIQDGFLVNNSGNTNIYTRNVRVAKDATGNNGDSVEVNGKGCDLDFYIDNAGIASLTAFASSYLIDSVAYIKVRNGNYGAEITLQAYTGGGTLSEPQIKNVDIYVNGGSIGLLNGNAASGITVGKQIRIHGQNGKQFVIGTNGNATILGGEIWADVTIDGTWIPTGNFAIYSVNGLVLDLVVDCSSLPNSAGLNGLFYVTSSGPAERPCRYVDIKNLVISNIAMGAALSYFWCSGVNASTNKIGEFYIRGGDISNNNTAIPLLAAAHESNIGSTSRLIVNLAGYNPQPVDDISVGASIFTWYNTNPYPVELQVNGGTVTSIQHYRAGNTVTLSITAGSIYMAPGDAVNVSYAVAPDMRYIPI